MSVESAAVCKWRLDRGSCDINNNKTRRTAPNPALPLLLSDAFLQRPPRGGGLENAVRETDSMVTTMKAIGVLHRWEDQYVPKQTYFDGTGLLPSLSLKCAGVTSDRNARMEF